MPLKKGQTNNPKGRPKGSKNKASRHLRESITEFLEDNFEVIQRSFKRMPPADKRKLYVDLLPYSMPKLSAVDMDIKLEKLTDEQLDELMEKVIAAVNDK